MKNVFVYDLPTRIFHWLFALSFVVAFTIGSTFDDESVLFSYHMIAGIVLFFLVIFRLIWGIFGSKYARFTGFVLKPGEFISYFKSLFTGDKPVWSGHNPASSWAAILMMLFALGLGVSGYLMTNSAKSESLEEVHELLANGFLTVVILHLAGIALHTVRHRDAIWKSMLSGFKSAILNEEYSVRSYRAIGLVLLFSTIGLSFYLTGNFDSKSRELYLFGSLYNLTEAGDKEQAGEEGEEASDEDTGYDEHDDDD